MVETASTQPISARCHANLILPTMLKRLTQLTPTKIYEDNQGALALANKVHLRNRSKHVGLRFCFVQRLIELGIISGEYNPSADQHSDIGTKFVSENVFEHHTPYLLGEVLPTKKT
jgi:hypothetical protein